MDLEGKANRAKSDADAAIADAGTASSIASNAKTIAQGARGKVDKAIANLNRLKADEATLRGNLSKDEAVQAHMTDDFTNFEHEIAPRIWEQARPVSALRFFAGMKVYITHAADMDSEALAGFVKPSLSSAGWRVVDLPPRPGSADVFGKGVQIEYLEDIPQDGASPDRGAKIQQMNFAKAAADALAKEFRRSRIGALVRRDVADDPFFNAAQVPAGTLWLRILAKPTPFTECKWTQEVAAAEKWPEAQTKFVAKNCKWEEELEFKYFEDFAGSVGHLQP